jgi:hypothetical protein
MKKIGVTYHPKSDAARQCAEEIRARISQKSVETWIASAWDDGASDANIDGTDLLFCCGGDGTVRTPSRCWASILAASASSPRSRPRRCSRGLMTSSPAPAASRHAP